MEITVQENVSPALDQAIRSLRSPDLMRNLGDAAAEVATRAFREEALRPSPWAPRPARSTATWPLLRHHLLLERSIRVVDCDANHVTISTDRPYAAYQQFGTRPYTIRPTNKRALMWAGSAHPVKVVHHPGLPARPFMPFTADGQPTAALISLLEMRARAFVKKIADAFSG